MATNLEKLPDIDAPCGKHFMFRDFIECSDTWKWHGLANIPKEIKTYNALDLLAAEVIDPVIDGLGRVKLTYGVGTPELTSKIRSRIVPRLDQHAAFELNPEGALICQRGGAACDFLVIGVDSLTAAKWVVKNTNFDRLYFYGSSKPLHVSVAKNPSRKCSVIGRHDNGRVVPITYSPQGFLSVDLHRKMTRDLH